MMIPATAFCRRGRPLVAVAVLISIIALATLLTGGPEPAQAQVPPPDTTAPTLKSVAVSRYTGGTPSTPPRRTDYSTLKLTFSEDLDPNSMPAGTAFRVVSRMAHTERNHVGTGVAIRGTSTGENSIAGRIIKVRLEGVGNPDWIFGGASLTVTYTKPTLNPLRDAAGNQVATFTASPPNRTGHDVECHWRTGNWYVTNMYGRAGEDSHIPCDTAKPAWRHSSQGNTIEWFYSDYRPAPPANQPVESVIYTVPGEPNHRAVRGTDGEYYREERVSGRWQRSVSYGTDAAAGRNASWNTYNRAVNHAMVNPDGGTFPSGAAPVAVMFDSATVRDNTLTLTFDQHLRSTSKPAPSAFTVTVNNARRSVAVGGVAVSGRNVTLTLTSAAAYGDTVTVRYTKPSANPLKGGRHDGDSRGLDNRIAVETFADQAVTNVTGGTVWRATLTTGPSGGNGNGCRADAPTPCSSALTEDSFTAGGITYQVQIVATGASSGGDAILDLGLNQAIPTNWRSIAGDWVLHVNGHRLAVSESSPINNMTARWTNPGFGFASGQRVDLRLAWKSPTLQSAAVDGETLRMTFLENMDTASKPAPSAFTVTVNNARRSVENDGVALSGNTVTLTLASAAKGSDTVKVRYTRPSANPLQDGDGNDVETFADRAVTNNSPLWSATLTARPSGQRGHGCRNGYTLCSAALSEDSFTVGGITYQVQGIATGISRQGSTFLDLKLDKAIPADWTLYVDDHPGLVVSSAILFYGDTRWLNPGFGFGSGDTFSLSLRAPMAVTATPMSSFLVSQQALPPPTALSTQSDPTFHVSIAANPVNPPVNESATFTATIANSPSEETPAYNWEIDFGGSWFSFVGGSSLQYGNGNAETLRFRVTVSYDSGESATSEPIAVTWVAIVESDPPAESSNLLGPQAAADEPPSADQAQANSPAAGAPGITGTARVGETLTADTSAISDSDGLASASFSYQWLADDADISGATGSAYTLASTDRGKAIKVRVSFTDDAGYEETLTSAATAAVAAKPPDVTGVRITSDPGDDDTYAKDDIIRISLAFDEKVDVDTSGGTPRIKIDMDPAEWGEKWASYASGSGTSALTFAHTVVEPNISTQGIAVLENTLELNGGTIQSDGEDANLSHTGQPHDANHKVDWQIQPDGSADDNSGTSDNSGGDEDGATGQGESDEEQSAPATVTGVGVSSSPASGDTYKLGETIQVTLNFSEEVDVTGTPRLKIDMDPAEWGEKWASYSSGSGTATIVFTHTVVEPNISTQGIAVLKNTLELNGGTIQANGVNADLAHTGLKHDAKHKVDWRPSTPTVESVLVVSDPGDDDTYGLGDVIRISVTFSEEVDVTGTPQLKIDMDPADWGEKWASYASGSGSATLIFTHTVVDPNYSTQGIAVLENTLELNGGDIESASTDTDADLSHTGLDHDPEHKVDWQLSDEGGPGS